MRKRTIGVLVLCTLLLVGLAGYLLLSGGTVQVGMSENEVEERLGGQGLLLKFDTEEDLKNCAKNMGMKAPPGASLKLWDWQHNSVKVLFDRDGKVVDVKYPRGVGRYINIALRSIGLD